MLAIFKLKLDFGRGGKLNGVFLAHKEDVENLIKSKIQVNFGEVLGKHSDIECSIDDSDITLVSDSEDVIKVFSENNLSSGHNPFDYNSIGICLEPYYVEDDLTETVRKWAELNK